MININTLRKKEIGIIAIGSHKAIIQSMLDFDYLVQKKQPSVRAIIASGRKFERYFFGKKEILIPVFASFDTVPSSLASSIQLFFNTTSARRVKESSLAAFAALTNLEGGTIFAENVPEKHAIELYKTVKNTNTFIIGPASVGLLVPGFLKLGAIGGTEYAQLVASDVLTSGSVAVLSASGGMVNEIIRIVAQEGKRLSFAVSFGGDRFPVLSPVDAFLTAEQDPQTKTIVYYGELGGYDEHAIAALVAEKKVTKKVICYIGGEIAEIFASPPQFGHAKAMAKNQGESAKEKREVLRNAGVTVANSFMEFVQLIRALEAHPFQESQQYSTIQKDMDERKHALIATTISNDDNGVVKLLGEDLLSFSTSHSFAYITTSLFLGKKITSKELEEFVSLVLRLLVDHGPQVSGAVNTIITARAGRDIVSSLAAGLLTVGPRFGGAINQAAANWLRGVQEEVSADAFVESFASQKQYISGIGHRKYRVDLPDPRVQALLAFSASLEKKRFTQFALSVEKITAGKKGNLILNVDGAIAAVMLDLLSEKEGLTDKELMELTHIEFFNSFFILSRSVGFLAHALDQKRLDEGLFRLDDDLVTNATNE